MMLLIEYQCLLLLLEYLETGQVGSVSVSGVADTPVTGLEASAGPHASGAFTVTVANSGSESSKFYIDGSEAPTLSLT